MQFDTLDEETRRYRLRDSKMGKEEIAKHLGCHAGEHNPVCNSQLSSGFYRNGDLVAIRTKRDEVAILHVFESVQDRMEKIADRIL